MLSKGLSFAPSCHFDVCQTISDVNNFARNITISRHFSNIESEDQDFSMNFMQKQDTVPTVTSLSFLFKDLITVTQLQALQAKSRKTTSVQPIKTKNKEFYPLQSRTASIEVFQEKVEQDFIMLHRNIKETFKGNLTASECKAIKELKQIDDVNI